MTAQPTVTVVIPVFNGASYLDECLVSAREQTYAQLDILVVDDGSTDGSQQIASRHAAADPRLTVAINPTRLGLNGNFTACIEQASGDWIKFLLQDDVIDPRCVERMVAAIADSPLVVCARDYTYESVSSLRRRRTEETLSAAITAQLAATVTLDGDAFSAVALQHLEVNFIGEPTALLVRRDAALANGPFDPRLTQILDVEFVVRLGSRFGVTFIPESLATVRIHGGQATAHHQETKALHVEAFDAILYAATLAHHPAYADLRAVAGTMAPPFDLAEAVQDRLVRGWFAVGVRRLRGAERSRALQQWAAVIIADPLLGPHLRMASAYRPEAPASAWLRVIAAAVLLRLPYGTSLVSRLADLRRWMRVRRGGS